MNVTPQHNQSILSDIDEETLAAWIDDTLSPEEADEIVDTLESADWLSALLDDYDDITESYESMIEEGYELPDEFLDNFPLPISENSLYDSFNSDDQDDQDDQIFSHENTNDSDNETEMFAEESEDNECMFLDESTSLEDDYYHAGMNASISDDSEIDERLICENTSESMSAEDEYSEWETDTEIQDNFDESVF